MLEERTVSTGPLAMDSVGTQWATRDRSVAAYSLPTNPAQGISLIWVGTLPSFIPPGRSPGGEASDWWTFRCIRDYILDGIL